MRQSDAARVAWRVPVITGMVVAVAIAPSLQAQGLSSPAGHWGAIQLPDVSERTEFSILLTGFTRYGKEQDATGRYVFQSYNDWQRTFGVNLGVYTSTRNLWSGKPIDDRRRQPTTASQWWRRRTFFLGGIDDRSAQIFQNHIIHQGRQDIPPVPRTINDTEGSIGRGEVSWSPLLWGWSEQYFFRFATTETAENGETIRVPTPFFIGAGWQLSNLNHEAFIDFGSSIWDLTSAGEEIESFTRHLWGLRQATRAVRRFASWSRFTLGTGAIARTGVLRRSHYFDDITSNFYSLQAVLRVGAEVALGAGTRFPIMVDLALTAHDGFFPRAGCTGIVGACTERTSAMRVHDKEGTRERFGAIRVSIGDFRFETYNDLITNKDKGPSFGAAVSWDVERLLAGRRRRPASERGR